MERRGERAMSRIMITAPVTIPSAGAGQPATMLRKGDVVEATPAMVTAISSAGATTRAVSTTTMHDQLGETLNVSNGS
jgi:hypothetical protein